MDRRARTRRLIELGGLIDKSGLEQLVQAIEPDARAVILGALLELADELREPASAGSSSARVKAWRERGRAVLRADPAGTEASVGVLP